jgi:NAD(P)-dependent dehydrogenase (short-subunit alcohol dehydrogenase family)
MSFLTGKTALVTGASRGIGAATSIVLARYGADVAVNFVEDRNLAEQVCAGISALGRRGRPVYADVTSEAEVASMLQEVEQQLGAVDILVNNAGGNPLNRILEMTAEDWDRALALNLKSCFLCSRAVLPGMVARGSGRIVSIASISGQRGGLAGDVDYSAAKAGILGFTRSLARWAAPRGINVNAIAPGYIDTERLRSDVAPERLAALAATIPLGRLGSAEEVGEIVAALAGPAGCYIVGEVIAVNGGVHMA